MHTFDTFTDDDEIALTDDEFIARFGRPGHAVDRFIDDSDTVAAVTGAVARLGGTLG